MGKHWQSEDFVRINLSVDNSELALTHGMKSLEDYVNNHIRKHHAQWAFGGYGERRNLYQSSPHFSVGKVRDFHLAIDIWGPPHSPIFLPYKGVIHSFAYNDQPLDYGYTVIVQHLINEQTIYSLYGHLDDYFYSEWHIGNEVEAGQIIARLGDYDQNGGWPPHLHFQLIKNIGNWQGDYPGVCSDTELENFLENCPDPLAWISLD